MQLFNVINIRNWSKLCEGSSVILQWIVSCKFKVKYGHAALGTVNNVSLYGYYVNIISL